MVKSINKLYSASLFICGDVLNKNKENGMICSIEISQIVNSVDYAVCNFEAPIEGFGKPEAKPGICLNQQAATITGLKKQGFDLLLLANNHMFDYGKIALEATLTSAKEYKIEILGAGLSFTDAYKPLIKKINGIKIGMINACEAQYGEINLSDNNDKAGYAWINHPVIETNIIRLRQQCDFVVVFAHAGLENYSIPQKEWRYKYKHFCDLGANVVIGSHPHVPQGFEKHGKSIIFYSLGNFYFDKINKENNSFAVKLKLRKEEEPEFEIIQHFTKDGIVQLASIEKCLNIEELNSFLEPNIYLKEHDKMTMETFNKIKRNLAISVFLPIPISGSFKDFIRMLASFILKRSRSNYKDLYQLHLLKNETYFHVIKDALELKAIKNYP